MNRKKTQELSNNQIASSTKKKLPWVKQEKAYNIHEKR